MKPLTRTLVALALLTGCTTAAAQSSLNHSAAASEHAAQASGHAISGASMAVATVVSIPLQAAGAIGQASGQASTQAGESLDAWANQPLTIAEQPIVAGPRPDRLLKTKNTE